MRTLLAFALCIGLVEPTKAEPGPVGRWLMDEPVSLFDLGMLRTQIQLDKLVQSNEKEVAKLLSIHTFYDWDANRIVISGSIHGDNPVDLKDRAKQLKSMCKVFFDTIRKEAFVDLNTGKPWPEYTVFASNFAHIGYSSRREPENFSARLDKIFEIRFFYPIGHKTLSPWRCHAPSSTPALALRRSEC